MTPLIAQSYEERVWVAIDSPSRVTSGPWTIFGEVLGILAADEDVVGHRLGTSALTPIDDGVADQSDLFAQVSFGA